MKEFDFIDSQTDETEGKVIMNAKALDAWNENLAAEIKSERYLMLSHTALALLRRIVGRFKSTDGIASLSSVVIRNKDIKLKSMPLHESAIKELKNTNCFPSSKTVSVHPAEICPLFMYQSIVKSFDHTLVNLRLSNFGASPQQQESQPRKMLQLPAVVNARTKPVVLSLSTLYFLGLYLLTNRFHLGTPQLLPFSWRIPMRPSGVDDLGVHLPTRASCLGFGGRGIRATSIASFTDS